MLCRGKHLPPHLPTQEEGVVSNVWVWFIIPEQNMMFARSSVEHHFDPGPI